MSYEGSELSSSPLSQLSDYHASRSKLISLLRHFYEKFLQIILQNRLNTSALTSSQDHWFNILYQYEPIQLDLSWMNGIDSENPFLQPLTLDIILSWKHLKDTKIYHNGKDIASNIKSVILEKWQISMATTKISDVDTKGVYKYTCQYFRLLISILKRLPTHNLLKSEKSKLMKRFGWHCTYVISTSSLSESEAFGVDQMLDDSDKILEYDLPEIETSMGAVQVNLKYRSPANFSMSSKSSTKLIPRRAETVEDTNRRLDEYYKNIPNTEIANHSIEDELNVQTSVLKMIKTKIVSMKQENYEDTDNDIFRMSFMDLNKLAD